MQRKELNLRTLLLFAASVVVVALPSWAQELPMGDYDVDADGASGTAEIDENGRISIAIASSGCFGAISNGRYKENVDGTWTARFEEDGNMCLVNISVDGDGYWFSTEGSGCMYFSGAACAFDGQYVPKNR